MRSNRFWLCAFLACLATLPVIVPAKEAMANEAPNRIRIEYEPPNNPAHQPLYEMIRERQFLEKLQTIFSPFKFPMEVTIKTLGCDGRANAHYRRPQVLICYELLAAIRREMPLETSVGGVTPIDAEIGQFFFAAAHEMGHAAFDLFSTPIFGRQEDAADGFATYIMLQLGKSDARRLITGAAYSYRKYLQHPSVTAPLKDFSDVHGAPQQRFFNLICYAYGADPVLFAVFVDKQFLPEHRAKTCRFEYGDLTWAFRQLIVPHLDQQLAKQVMDQTWLPPEQEKRPSN